MMTMQVPSMNTAESLGIRFAIAVLGDLNRGSDCRVFSTYTAEQMLDWQWVLASLCHKGAGPHFVSATAGDLAFAATLFQSSSLFCGWQEQLVISAGSKLVQTIGLVTETVVDNDLDLWDEICPRPNPPRGLCKLDVHWIMKQIENTIIYSDSWCPVMSQLI